MSDSLRGTLAAAQNVTQRLAMVVVATTALGLSGIGIAAGLGHLPWLEMTARFGAAEFPQAGMAVQLAVTALLLCLCFYLPANARLLALEQSHRSFRMGMRDVALAYGEAHRADRQGAFALTSEFDSIRERIEFLRRHPDLRDLEPGVIELAAQMSHISRELAHTYCDANVARARDFLIQRQQEIVDFNERIAEAKAISAELKRWYDRVDLEEAVARSQLDWLRDELAEILPEVFAPPRPAPATEAPAPAAARSDPEPDAPDRGDDQRIVELLQRRAQR